MHSQCSGNQGHMLTARVSCEYKRGGATKPYILTALTCIRCTNVITWIVALSMKLANILASLLEVLLWTDRLIDKQN